MDPDFLSLHEIRLVAEKIGTDVVHIFWYKHPDLPLHLGLNKLATDRDIILITKLVPKYRVIDVYLSHEDEENY